MADYTVGPSSDFRQVQDAIDALIQDQGSTTFTEEHRVLINEPGVYRPYKVPAGSLTPTDTYRFFITGKTGMFPTIAGALDLTTGYNGVSIGTPYTTVSNQWVRNCVRGVLFEEAATDGVLSNSFVAFTSKTGVTVWKADDFWIYNTTIHHSPICLLAYQVSNFACFHNTLVAIPDRAYEVKAALVYRVPGSSVGSPFIHNNNIVAYGGTCMDLDKGTYENIDSDYNNLYYPGGSIVRLDGSEAVIENRHGNAAKLDAWRQLTSLDINSVSTDPRFIQRETHSDDFTGIWIDMSLLDSSPLVRKGENTQSASGYPSQVVASDMAYDVYGGNRGTLPTIGAFEKLVKIGFYGDHILHKDGASDPCGDTISQLDVAAAQYQKAVNPWYPKVHTGYFYVRDMQYYLYSNKQSSKIGGCTWSQIDTATEWLHGTVSVKFQGEVLADNYWNIRGQELVFKHNDLPITTLFEEVTVTGEYRTWNDTTRSFDTSTGELTFDLIDGTQRYFLEPSPVGGAPIVVTDDSIDERETTGDLPYGYYVEYDEDLGATELLLDVSNTLQNPQFEYFSSVDSEPAHWTVYAGSPTVQTSAKMYGDHRHPYIGHGYLQMNSGDVIGQEIHGYSESSPYYFRVSAFPTTGSPVLNYQFVYYDTNGLIVDDETGQMTISGHWADEVRFSTGASKDVTVDRAVLKIGTDYGAGVEAVQLDPSTENRYTRLPRLDDMTVEWEGSDSGVYEITDLTLNPMTNPMPNGFLCILAVPADQFDDLAPSGTHTLIDYEWQNGRLTYLPWAKVSGKNKWHYVDRNNPVELAPDITYTAPVAEPDRIIFSPDPVHTVQGNTGEELYFRVYDEQGNPFAHEGFSAYTWESTGNFPGYIAMREYGYYTRLGYQILGETNSAGAVAIRYIPPEAGDVEINPAIVNVGVGTHGESVYYVTTKYEIAPENHGNPTLTGPDGTVLTETGQLVTGEFTGYNNGDFYEYGVGRYPYPDTVSVWDDNIRQFEVFHSSPGDGQFYLDYEGARLLSPSSGPLTVNFTPRTVWKDPRYARRIFFSTTLTVPDQLRVNHDARVYITAQAVGQDRNRWARLDITCLNPDALEER